MGYSFKREKILVLDSIGEALLVHAYLIMCRGSSVNADTCGYVSEVLSASLSEHRTFQQY